MLLLTHIKVIGCYGELHQVDWLFHVITRLFGSFVFSFIKYDVPHTVGWYLQ